MKVPAKTLLLGGIILDRYLEVDSYPQAGQDTLIRRSFDVVGGCCLNVAVTLKNLGSLPYIVNRFGDDEIGARIEQYVGSLALSKTCMQKLPGGQTGYCLTVLDRTGERTFFTYKGCEIGFSLEEFSSQLTADLSFVYITGYYLLDIQTTASVLELVRHLRQNGCQILLDPGPLVGEMDSIRLRELLMVSDWLVPNSNELAIIQNKIGVSGNLVNWLFDQGAHGAAVKKGNQGVDIFTPSSAFTIGGFPVDPVDTNGAGDSFAGGFIHGLANGYSLRQAAILASACGAFTTTIKGPHGVFSLEDINHFIATFKENKL